MISDRLFEARTEIERYLTDGKMEKCYDGPIKRELEDIQTRMLAIQLVIESPVGFDPTFDAKEKIYRRTTLPAKTYRYWLAIWEKQKRPNRVAFQKAMKKANGRKTAAAAA